MLEVSLEPRWLTAHVERVVAGCSRGGKVIGAADLRHSIDRRLTTKPSSRPSRVKAAEFEIDREIERRVEKSIEDEATGTHAQRAFKECDSFKYRPRDMNQGRSLLAHAYPIIHNSGHE